MMRTRNLVGPYSYTSPLRKLEGVRGPPKCVFLTSSFLSGSLQLVLKLNGVIHGRKLGPTESDFRSDHSPRILETLHE